MNQQIDRQTLEHICQAEDIEQLAPARLVQLFQEEPGLAGSLPDGIYQIDPRNGDRVLFNTSRARRPHDNRPEEPAGPRPARPCVVCQGKTTGIVDLAPLSEGFTFINKNLYPILYPRKPEGRTSPRFGHDSPPVAIGLHFLQWTSSFHDRDWHNMPQADRVIVLRRLAALERKLLTGAGELLPPSPADSIEAGGFVSIIKNVGALVGGSLEHGHQQIAFSNVMPRRIEDNWRFQQRHGETFSAYLLRENPAELLLRDYGPAVLLTPYFMRRPYDMLLLLKDAGKQHLHELNDQEFGAIAAGWGDAISLIRQIMPRIGRELAYNVITHNGPGAGLYIEFLPYTQETGGFEHLGLLVCQSNPGHAALQSRQILSGEMAS